MGWCVNDFMRNHTRTVESAHLRPTNCLLDFVHAKYSSSQGGHKGGAIKLKDMKLVAFAQWVGMSSGLRPEPKLGPFFLLSLRSTLTTRLLYWRRFMARPVTRFFARSVAATLGA